MTISANIKDQGRETFEDLNWCLEQPGCRFEDMLRISVIVADASGYLAA